MLINSHDGYCYLIDRNFNFRTIQMRFPNRDNLTLLDGEMVIDTDLETHEQERKYLVFDLMAINGVCVIECPFGERWKMLDEQVIGPRNLESEQLKKFWLLSDINHLVKEFSPRLLHDADGLIFQGWNDKYWKSHDMNSVDFLFQLVGTAQNPSLYLYDRGRKKCMYGNRVVFRNGEDPSPLSGNIIECS
ncbi:hypothetical protein MKX01_011430 [Papaver californicum]|nr:hypothetical protein MKX01_011430 [Papaver californicum]